MARKQHSETFRGIEYTYYHDNSNVSIVDAESNCTNQGAELAYTKDNATWVKVIKYPLSKGKAEWWIGLRRKDGNLEWKWLDGDKYELEKEIQGTDRSDLNCGTIKVHNSYTAFPNGLDCRDNRVHNYICQTKKLSDTSAARKKTSTDTTTQATTMIKRTHFDISGSQGINISTTTATSNFSYTGMIIALAVIAVILILAIVLLLWKYKAKQKKNSNSLLEVSYTSCHATSNDVGDYAEISRAQNFDPCPQTLHSTHAYDRTEYASIDQFRGDSQEVAQQVNDIQQHDPDAEGTSEQVTYAQVNKPRNTTNVQHYIEGDVYAQVDKSK